jgi:hypothetical protein
MSYTEFHTHRSRNMGQSYIQKFIYTPKYSMTVTNMISIKLMFARQLLVYKSYTEFPENPTNGLVTNTVTDIRTD